MALHPAFNPVVAGSIPVTHNAPRPSTRRVGAFLLELTIMHDLSDKYLMMIEPEPAGKLVNLINPVLVEKGRKVLALAEDKARYRGFHTCSCGERSDNAQWILPNGVETNSLLPHYLEKHLEQVPQSEIDKLLRFYDEFIGQPPVL